MKNLIFVNKSAHGKMVGIKRLLKVHEDRSEIDTIDSDTIVRYTNA